MAHGTLMACAMCHVPCAMCMCHVPCAMCHVPAAPVPCVMCHLTPLPRFPATTGNWSCSWSCRRDGVSQRNRGADVGLETALLERTRHTARSPCERRTRPHWVPGPPGPGLEVARGGRRLGRLGLFAKPLPAPHSRAPRERFFQS
jgi:hypothetical protein